MSRIAVFSVLLWLLASPGWAQSALFPKNEDLTIETGNNYYLFTVEIAETPEQQKTGLMHRRSLESDHGMLFIMPKDRMIHMWMKDTPLSLDMLFIDKHGKIIYIAKNTKPDSTNDICAGRVVRAVLEIPAGTVKREHIRVGDHIIHPYFKP